MTIKDELIEKYSVNSKHSNYQVLPTKLKEIIGEDEVQTKTRFERERLDYLLSKIDVTGKSVLDIGGNTGYFTFELLDQGASQVMHFEGNRDHSDFVKLAAVATENQDKIEVINGYFPFDDTYSHQHDVILLFNVLHHTGDDYGDKGLTLEVARNEIAKQLNSLGGKCTYLVFQLGFNWRGDPTQGLFANGTKKEMIDFVRLSTAERWEMMAIGIAQKHNNKIIYEDLTEENDKRDDTLGEFLNRPIFILKAKT